MEVTEKIITLMDGVEENGNVRVKTIMRIFIDGKQSEDKLHRHVLTPGDDLTQQDPIVAALAAIVHTPELIAERHARDAETARLHQEAIDRENALAAMAFQEAVDQKAADDAKTKNEYDKIADLQSKLDALTALISASLTQVQAKV